MNRRSFLRTTLAAAALPGWLSIAFAADKAPSGLAALTAAWQRASEGSRPLLVILIPDDTEKGLRGDVLGAWINYGDERLMATLGLCEVVCARAEDVQRLLPSAKIGPRTWMVLAETGKVPAQTLAVDVPLTPDHPAPAGTLPAAVKDLKADPEEAWYAREAQDNALSEAQCTLVSERLYAAMPPSWTEPLKERKRREELAAEANKKLRTEAPAGVHWANSGGCATMIEGVEPTMMVGCGMGYVAARTQRFLYFYPVTDGIVF